MVPCTVLYCDMDVVLNIVVSSLIFEIVHRSTVNTTNVCTYVNNVPSNDLQVVSTHNVLT